MPLGLMTLTFKDNAPGALLQNCKRHTHSGPREAALGLMAPIATALRPCGLRLVALVDRHGAHAGSGGQDRDTELEPGSSEQPGEVDRPVSSGWLPICGVWISAICYRWRKPWGCEARLGGQLGVGGLKEKGPSRPTVWPGPCVSRAAVSGGTQKASNQDRHPHRPGSQAGEQNSEPKMRAVSDTLPLYWLSTHSDHYFRMLESPAGHFGHIKQL